MLIVGITIVIGIATGINMISNQSALSAETTTGNTGVSFGLYRTFSYLGAILSGTQMKVLFHNGVSDHSLHLSGWYASISCCILIILYIPTLKNNTGKKQKNAE